jgi:glutamate-1-semialdehyde aminotransferase
MSASETESGRSAAERTRELTRRAGELLAYGGHHRLLLRPVYAAEEGVFPEFAERVQGYELIDSTGRRYIDWASAWGPVILGYRHPAVEEAISAQLAAGPTLSLMHPVELDVASMLTEMIPCAEMVAFGKNGSDVVTAAVRVARAATGRELILQHGFHGFHDWYTCQYRAKNVHGISTALRAFVHQFPYNDLDALEWLFCRYPGEVAAVVMEPVNLTIPEPGYLEGVLRIAHDHGALLVFDEMVTGFRLANGGAQELFGVTPDLACVGKGLANGMPLAAIVGKREYMRHLPETAYGMTFRGETLSLAAARAVLGVLQEEPVTEHLARVGTQVREAFHEACEREGIGCELLGPPPRMSFVFKDGGGLDPERLRTLFVRECARNGVLTTGTLLPTYAHDQDAIDQTLQAFALSLRTLSEAIRTGGEAIAAAVRAGFTSVRNGAATGPPAGAIDIIRVEVAQLRVSGWLLFGDGCADEVSMVAPNGAVRHARTVTRPDVADAFPGVGGAESSGYEAMLPAAVFAPEGAYDFTIEARSRTGEEFRCRIVRPREGLPDSPLGAPRFGEDRALQA